MTENNPCPECGNIMTKDEILAELYGMLKRVDDLDDMDGTANYGALCDEIKAFIDKMVDCPDCGHKLKEETKLINHREDCLYIYQVLDTEYDNANHRMTYTLTKQHIFFDKGRAIYYRGFDNPFILIGLFRTIMNEPIRSLIMQTGHKMGDVFEIDTGNMLFVAMWTGDWTPLERIGFIGTLFNTSVLQQMINEIMTSYEDNGQVLKDRG